MANMKTELPDFYTENDIKNAFTDGYVAGVEAAQSKWISVEDELPPVGERVLACVGRCVVYEGFINCNEKWIRSTGGYEFVGGVTHWMPLPEAPKEG